MVLCEKSDAPGENVINAKLEGDRTFKLASGTTSEYGVMLNPCWEP
jgi:hypothetical protein